jgi:hypothetical protein
VSGGTHIIKNQRESDGEFGYHQPRATLAAKLHMHATERIMNKQKGRINT